MVGALMGAAIALTVASATGLLDGKDGLQGRQGPPGMPAVYDVTADGCPPGMSLTRVQVPARHVATGTGFDSIDVCAKSWP